MRPHSIKNRYDIDERRNRVAALMLESLTTRQIEQRLGIGHGTVMRDIAAVRAEWQERRVTDVGTWVAEELKRLDVAMAAIWSEVLRGSTWHIDRMLAIMERRAKYLGLDAKADALPATQMQVVILNGGPDRVADPNSLAALWSSRTALLEQQAGDHAVGSSEHGKEPGVSRISA